MHLKRNLYGTIMVLLTLVLFSFENTGAKTFYVDPGKGSDQFPGTLEKSFQTIDKALDVVRDRVEKGIFSDTVYLRGGVYRKQSAITLYHFDMKGTPEHYAVFSAMPCDSTSSGAVKRKSGRWYEKVVFDDGYPIQSKWTKVPGRTNIWQTNPGYTHFEWLNQKLWPWTWREKYIQITDHDETPETTSFTVAPYMLLQDGEPTLWAENVNDITESGMRTYDNLTKTLYFRPFEDKDPNSCNLESWYGGPEDYDIGTLLLDGEGRALFDGNLEYVSIRGFEFRMFTRLFELHRRGYKNESERVIQKNVRFEDNLTTYCWINILLDANTVMWPDTEDFIRPRYNDRAEWNVCNNVFYRPSREVCQLHGDNHRFEYNEIIDHNGPWAGPAACVSAVNARNARNMKIRYNYVRGQGNTRWNTGSVFMIEAHNSTHGDSNGDYVWGGQTYEYNIIADVSEGTALFLGKGEVRMKDITVRNNIFLTNRRSPAIILSSPHENLIIENNIFFDQLQPIKIIDDSSLFIPPLPSSIRICNNIFVNNIGTISARIFECPNGSHIMIDNNLFYKNEKPGIGTRILNIDPMFRNPENLDFRLKENSPEIVHKRHLGVFMTDTPVKEGTDWWRIKEQSSEALPVMELERANNAFLDETISHEK